jgi:hypothetical protein
MMEILMANRNQDEIADFGKRIRKAVADELEVMGKPASALVSSPHEGTGGLVQTPGGLRPISVSEEHIKAPEAELRRLVGVQLARAFQAG